MHSKRASAQRRSNLACSFVCMHPHMQTNYNMYLDMYRKDANLPSRFSRPDSPSDPMRAAIILGAVARRLGFPPCPQSPNKQITILRHHRQSHQTDILGRYMYMCRL